MPGEEITLWIAFTAGLASFVSPCVLPLIPSFITYINRFEFSAVTGGSPWWTHPFASGLALSVVHCRFFPGVYSHGGRSR